MSDAYEALHAYFVDTLVDLADPAPQQEDDVRGDMQQAVAIIFDGLSIEVVGATADSVTFVAKF